MVASALTAGVDRLAARGPPRPSVAWLIATAGLAAAGTSCALVLMSELVAGELGEPLVIALLTVWLTLSYVLCGVFAWWRRPTSGFGRLMIAAGFANFGSTLSMASSDVPFTIGQALDLLPPVLFLHVFLAFPDGRLRGRFVRALVVSSYVTAIGLQLVRMSFGEFGPHNLLALQAKPGLTEAALKIQLTLISAFCLTGIAVLLARRWRAGRPLRRSLTLLVDAFAFGLVMIALLLVSAAFGGPWVHQIRWATFGALALAPVVFLLGLLRARLARSALGDLVVELRVDLAPPDLRDALARALRDPSLELA